MIGFIPTENGQFYCWKWLKKTWAYLDNLSTAGNIQEEHNKNLSKLLAAARKHNFTFNENKSIVSVELNYLFMLFPINALKGL